MSSISIFKGLKLMPILALLVATWVNPSVQANSLHRAIIQDKEKKALKLIAKNKGINERYKRDERTPLLQAIARKRANIVDALLQAGADPNLPTSDGLSPLSFALSQNLTDFVQPLLDHAAAISLDEHSPIYYASKARRRHILLDLLNRVDVIDAQWFRDDPDKFTALHYAALMNRPDWVRQQLDTGADVNLLNDAESTPLMVLLQKAKDKNIDQVLAMLLSAGTNLQQQDHLENDALDLSIKSGQTDATSQIIRSIGLKPASSVAYATALNEIFARLKPFTSNNLYSWLSKAGQPTGKRSGALFGYSSATPRKGFRWYGSQQILYDYSEELVTEGTNARGKPLLVRLAPTAGSLRVSEFSGTISALGPNGSLNFIADMRVGPNGKLPPESDMPFGDFTVFENKQPKARFRHIEGRWYIYRHQADAYAIADLSANETTSSESNTKNTLLKAAAKGDIELARRLLPESDIDQQDAGGSTALAMAARGGHYYLIKLLLNSGANVNLANKRGMTPLMWATMYGNSSEVDLILEFGPTLDLKTHQGVTATMHAAKRGRYNALSMLLDAGANPFLTDVKGNNAMMYAAAGGNVATLILLTQHGLSIQKPNQSGETPLMQAAMNGKRFFVERALKEGAVVDAQAINGQTALMIAAYHNKAKVAKILLDQGADASLAAMDGRTARTIAEAKKHKDILAMMSKVPAKAVEQVADEVVFTGNIMSLVGSSPTQADVISADAKIFNEPPLTDGAPFFRTAPGGFSQVFNGTLVAFKGDVAEVFVPNGIRDKSITIRCRVNISTRGIAFNPESVEGIAQELRWMMDNPASPRPEYKITGDKIRAQIGKPAKIGAAGENCAHFSLTSETH